MGETSQQSGRTKVSRRAWLFGFLALMGFGWAILIVRAPMLLQGDLPRFLLDRDTGLARLTLSNDDGHDPWSQEICFDVNSGALDWKMSREIDGTFFHVGTDKGNSKYRVLYLGDGAYRLVSLHDSNIPDREFEFPSYLNQVNDRFAVGESNTFPKGSLTLMDFADESSTIKTIKLPGNSQGGGIKPIDGVDAFLRFQLLVPAFGNMTKYRIQHFNIGSDLVVTSGVTWEVLILGVSSYSCVANCGQEIVSINPTSFEVEFREANSGKLIESMPLKKGMNPVTMSCGFWGDFLWIEPMVGTPRFLDLKRRKWLPLIEGGNFNPNEIMEEKLIHVRGLRGKTGPRSKIFDLENGVVILEFDSHTFTDFIDEDSLLDVSFYSGLTFQKIDLRTGEVLETWKPFWWVNPLTSFLCVSWLIWSWFWLSSSGRSRPATVWSDVAIVSLLPLVLCIVRLRYIGNGNVTDLQRLPTEIAQGIIVSLLACGVVWLVHSRTRIVPRVLPFLLATTVMAASVTITFDGQLAYVVPGAIQAFVPVSVFLTCFLGIRRMGYRLFAPGELEVATPIAKANLVTIRDMFLLTAVLAMLFAGLMPWLPSLGDISQSLQQVMAALGFFAILSLAPIVAWCLAMSKTKLRRLGDVLFLGTFAFLIASAAYRFSGSSSLILDWFGFYPSISKLPAMCFVATYWIASCFKLGGWEFTRKNADIASEG